MSNPGNPTPQRSLIARIWTFATTPTSRFSLATLLIVGGIGGLLFWGGFNWAMEVANTESFCISCHEMRDNPYKELQQTIHYKNRSGVRATCSDCHVPHEWFYKVRRKIQASNELLHKVLGTVNTPEKFERHRLELAEHVWATMKASDSHECRNCHSAAAMDPHKQTETAAKVMAEGFKAGLTCIDCHKGIAHKLPTMPDEEEEKSSNAHQGIPKALDCGEQNQDVCGPSGASCKRIGLCITYFADTSRKKPSKKNNHRRNETDFRSQYRPVCGCGYPEKCRNE